jgi:hypothetical protein
VLQRSSWVDYGKDYYAAVSWNDVPDRRRIAIGWMSNWQYAGATPTSPWRSAMSVPRELGLETIHGRTQLVQRPVQELRSLRTGPAYRRHRQTIPQGSTTLPARGKTLAIDADLRLDSAKRAGLKVRTGNGQETVIGYDAGAGELYVDRTRSGTSDFNRNFAGEQRAPLTARNGKVHLHILVDWSSVEVFADHGQTVITDQIFPDATSDGIELFADGGSATLERVKIQRLRSSWQTDDQHDDDDEPKRIAPGGERTPPPAPKPATCVRTLRNLPPDPLRGNKRSPTLASSHCPVLKAATSPSSLPSMDILGRFDVVTPLHLGVRKNIADCAEGAGEQLHGAGALAGVVERASERAGLAECAAHQRHAGETYVRGSWARRL